MTVDDLIERLQAAHLFQKGEEEADATLYLDLMKQVETDGTVTLTKAQLRAVMATGIALAFREIGVVMREREYQRWVEDMTEA